jgi:hypothetical protein
VYKEEKKILLLINDGIIKLDIFTILKKEGFNPVKKKSLINTDYCYDLIITDDKILYKNTAVPVIYLSDRKKNKFEDSKYSFLEMPFLVEDLIKAVYKFLK